MQKLCPYVSFDSFLFVDMTQLHMWTVQGRGLRYATYSKIFVLRPAFEPSKCDLKRPLLESLKGAFLLHGQ